MRKINSLLPVITLVMAFLMSHTAMAQAQAAKNPIIHADVPDMSMVRVGDTYYMSSTTMHMSPGVPIMKSKDLVNWELINYAYDRLGEVDAINMENGKNAYGAGSWASCLRYHEGMYYVSTFSSTTGKTYIFTTDDLENGPWESHSFSPSYHDHTLFFDDGKIYLIWGGGKLSMVEVKEDLSGVKPGTERVLIENATAPSGPDVMLPAEGSQLFKVDGNYYLFNISWPQGGMRTVIVHRADQINGPYEGRVMLQDKGVAQGGLIDTPDGTWYAYLFRDYGAVGRIPYLVPVQWQDGWPVLGAAGKVPDQLDLPANKSLIPGIVASDDFDRKKKDRDLPLVWQWNHNPDPEHWSVRKRKGFLRLTTARVDKTLVDAKNTLTQRTIGPYCEGIIKMDVSDMKDGDFAGLALLQKLYGQVGVKAVNGEKVLVMVNADAGEPEEIERIPFHANTVYLKATGDFTERKDEANFYYSLDGKDWKPIGSTLHMKYTLPHFMGYRFGLFNYATKSPGGHVDFDFFHITDTRR
ncbi:glycoside hydrolase family 43 protein [Echinicola vietnamensis]|uniref:Beta-xylosidase n=1 Tax=Echinicola vietnamensis (strain DSM 17526 / LMG 23754 / KMM 6221) TaxID=926556 RepID=L0FYA7_ECHVK|nr:beta-xylosidase [Echinicola vietnamensis DSM 17526]